ncbi:hypothetical protein ACH79_35315 [Bradyrhizobium sp. CCBAU 051011]|uniref:hypothetical protein n=1 Tax=Bradyrhizobium sp. CCBAU 051011 TaxID=858422 RepID=UPI001373F89B|nr:hypothetical protein [Bradyrhizobium sp. CCBAU 051011]QHO77129.1 hypothetical protein ACH79_35315 [Bradyrhizobium sp. CCBAU 051011]
MNRVVQFCLQATISIVSILLWLTLSGDLRAALISTIKFPVSAGHPIGDVRLVKLGLCLLFSCLLLASYFLRGLIYRRGAALLLTVSLLVLPAAILFERELLLSTISVRYPSLLELAFIFLPLGLSSGCAYPVLKVPGQEWRLTTVMRAVSLGAAALMLWIGLFDLTYPGIKWR